MKPRLIHVLALVALTLTAAVAPVGTASAKSGVRGVEGRVLSVDRSERSFRLRDAERGTFTIFVTASTRFERVSFSGLSAGRGIEAKIRRSNGRWVATKVQPRSATGSHTSSSSSDDNGGRGRGTDDGPNHT
jgi:hypothetical protein